MLSHVLNMYYITVDELFQLDGDLSDNEVTKRTRILSELCQVNDELNGLKDIVTEIDYIGETKKTKDLIGKAISILKRLQGVDEDLMRVESIRSGAGGERYQKRRVICEKINVLKYWEQILINLDLFLEEKQSKEQYYIPNFLYLFTDHTLRYITIKELKERLKIQNTRYYKVPDLDSIKKLTIELELATEEINEIIHKMKHSFQKFVCDNDISLVEHL